MTFLRVNTFLIGIVSVVVIPFQLITTFLLGILFSTFLGAVLIPIFSLIWMVCFLGPLIGLSYLFEKMKYLRYIIGILGIPFSFLGAIYSGLIPSMGEWESRFIKIYTCQYFPYSWHLWKLYNKKWGVKYTDGFEPLMHIVEQDLKTSFRSKVSNQQLTDFLVKLKYNSEKL